MNDVINRGEQYKHACIEPSREIKIMGIVNLTENSYYSPSRCLSENGLPDEELFVKKVGKLAEEGADIIDMGACSTRPGSEPVGETEEWRRIEPALHYMKKYFPKTKFSIDTYWSSVVKKAYDKVGEFIVNDISAGEDDEQMLKIVGQYALPYVAMHKRGTPKTMQSLTDYNDVTEDILAYFDNFEKRAEKYGIKDWVLDPGFGFAKTIDQNYQLIRDLGRFAAKGHPILVGISRKSMIFRLFDITPQEALPATQVIHFEALRNGADILRVHDVAEAKRTVALYRKLS